jgi:chemotaxis protein MotB
MARKHKHPEHVNHERWLVSYADFITLLFAFFVVMFAVSQVDTNKVGRFTESVERATRWGVFEKVGSPAPIAGHGGATKSASSGSGRSATTGTPGAGAGAAGMGGLANLRSQIEARFREAIDSGRIEITQNENGVIIRLKEAGFFAPGSDALEERSSREVADIGRWLNRFPNPVQIEGHTDSKPLRGGRFRTNWELAAARAARVLEILTNAGFTERRLSVASYAHLRPVASNDTEGGRRKNRRVDLVVLAMPVIALPAAPPPPRRVVAPPATRVDAAPPAIRAAAVPASAKAPATPTGT